MKTVLTIDDIFYLDETGKCIYINYVYGKKGKHCMITKEKAKEIIEFLTKFVGGE